MALSMFFPSVSGMESQSNALGSVSQNIANVSTVGYKADETLFQTLLGNTVKSNASGLSGSKVDTHGVSFYNRTYVNKQGEIASTGNVYDVAINRQNAFFMVKDENNNIYYTRAGDFGVKDVNGTAYLTTSQGMNVQGFPALEGGGFGTTAEDIIFNNQEKVPSIPTSKISITANVPASGVDTSSYGINMVGPNNDGESMQMIFTRVEGKVNTWEVSFTLMDGTVVMSPTEVIFDGNGQVLTPKSFDISVNWDDGSSNNVVIDISNMTQFAGNSSITNIDNDGRASGYFLKSYIDSDGVLKASYSNGQVIDYAKLALVGFTAPENLTAISGTLFYASNDVGDSYYVMNYDTVDNSMLQTQALESSNVSLEEEFSRMIIIQRAYSANTKTFTATNEMITTLVNLKS